MIIDLSDWNEYIADDVPPGPIPYETTVEIMQILTSHSYKPAPMDNWPVGLKPREDSVRVRLFWRIKK